MSVLGVGDRQREARALEERAIVPHIGEGRDARARAAMQLRPPPRSAPGAARAASGAEHRRHEQPVGASARRIWISAPGRSLTRCSASPDTTRLRLPSLKGSSSSSQTSDWARAKRGKLRHALGVDHRADRGEGRDVQPEQAVIGAEVERAREWAQHDLDPLGDLRCDMGEQGASCLAPHARSGRAARGAACGRTALALRSSRCLTSSGHAAQDYHDG